ncbi:RNA polymerase sigma factor, partial [bacterium]|nr:RNA polymerase sigma factor [bacterium]
VEVTINKRELKDNVHKAIAKLPLKQRKVLILCEIEGFSQQKVSDIMGISEGTVRSRLFYARKKLQKHLIKYVRQ